MSFQAYLDTIEAKTGKRAPDWRAYAAGAQWMDGDALKPGLKAGEIVDHLKANFGLGHGHSMAIYALLNGTRNEGDGK